MKIGYHYDTVVSTKLDLYRLYFGTLICSTLPEHFSHPRTHKLSRISCALAM